MFSGSVESLQATWQSTTVPVKPLSHDRLYYFLPYWDEKPTVYIRSGFPDHRRRMYNSNAITKIADKVVRNYAQIIENFSHFDEGLEVLIPSILLLCKADKILAFLSTYIINGLKMT